MYKRVGAPHNHTHTHTRALRCEWIFWRRLWVSGWRGMPLSAEVSQASDSSCRHCGYHRHLSHCGAPTSRNHSVRRLSVSFYGNWKKTLWIKWKVNNSFVYYVCSENVCTCYFSLAVANELISYCTWWIPRVCFSLVLQCYIWCASGLCQRASFICVFLSLRLQAKRFLIRISN